MYKTKVLKGRVKVTTQVGNGRIQGVWYKGKYYSPKRNFTRGTKFVNTRIKIGKSKKLYYIPKRN